MCNLCCARMDHVDLKIAVFTNLATDAAEEGEFDELLEAQGAIFRRLTDPTTQRAIINLDGAFRLMMCWIHDVYLHAC